MTIRLIPAGAIFYAGLVAACGGANDDTFTTVGTGGVSGASGGATGTGGNPEGTGSNNSGGSGMTDPACSEPFEGEGRVITEGVALVSPAITDDRLEVFYVQGAPGREVVHVATRESVSDTFQRGVSVNAVNSTCQPGEDRSVDVSGDGLRLYVSCHFDLESLSPMYVFTRASRSNPFGAPREVGSHVASFGVSYDELSAFGSTLSGAEETLVATRTSIDAPFEAPSAAPGLENVKLFAPTISPDGLTLIGATGPGRVMAQARRENLDEPFGPAVPIFAEGSPYLREGLTVGGADMAGDCHRMIFVVADGTDRSLIEVDR